MLAGVLVFLVEGTLSGALVFPPDPLRRAGMGGKPGFFPALMQRGLSSSQSFVAQTWTLEVLPIRFSDIEDKQTELFKVFILSPRFSDGEHAPPSC